MTNDEAIKILEDTAFLAYQNASLDEINEAVGMAIEALKAQLMEKDTTSDCISRQGAIDICNNVIDMWQGQLGEGALVAIKNAINNLPSVQPEIIRCKDCKNSEHWYRDRRRCFLWSDDGVSVFDDGFCNYAERRTDG